MRCGKLRELARRQQQEAERQRQQAIAGQGGQGGGASQRALGGQAEEVARQLEAVVARAQSSRPCRPRRPRDRRPIRCVEPLSGDPRAGQASAALGQLREAQRRLEQEQEPAGSAICRARSRWRKTSPANTSSSHRKRCRRHIECDGPRQRPIAPDWPEEAYELEAKVNELEKQIDRMSGEMRRNEREASRKLQEAADGIRNNRLEEQIHYREPDAPDRPNEPRPRRRTSAPKSTTCERGWVTPRARLARAIRTTA